MSFAEFQASVAHERLGGTAEPPEELSAPLQALWHDARGGWDAAHACVQDDTSKAGAWVHAYLHRKEGDAGNAAYWYQRAGRKMPEGAPGAGLAEEWAAIAQALLG